jgi:hypothetical protein
MITAMAAAVSAASTLRLVAGLTELSGTSTLAVGVGGLEGRRGATGAGACPAGLLNATGRANADGELMIAWTGTLLTGALWRPTE